jgi:hypothetical protein
LDAPAGEQRIGDDQKCGHPLLCHRRKRRIAHVRFGGHSIGFA